MFMCLWRLDTQSNPNDNGQIPQMVAQQLNGTQIINPRESKLGYFNSLTKWP